MATSDHTSRARSSEPFWLVNESQLQLSPELAKQHTSLMRVSGTAMAMHVIRNLMKQSAAAQRALAAGKEPHDRTHWPLSPTEMNGLRAALYFLGQHGDALLKAERGTETANPSDFCDTSPED